MDGSVGINRRVYVREEGESPRMTGHGCGEEKMGSEFRVFVPG